jgi:hypothetical protein
LIILMVFVTAASFQILTPTYSLWVAILSHLFRWCKTCALETALSHVWERINRYTHLVLLLWWWEPNYYTEEDWGPTWCSFCIGGTCLSTSIKPVSAIALKASMQAAVLKLNIHSCPDRCFVSHWNWIIFVSGLQWIYMELYFLIWSWQWG